MMYALIAWDNDYYDFQTFIGVFSSKDKAQEYIDNDYEICGDKKFHAHQEYEIYSIEVDKPLWEKGE